MRYFVTILFFFTLPALTLAEVFKTVETNGNILYSDSPANTSSQVVDLPPDTGGENSNESTDNNENGKPNSTHDTTALPLELKNKPYTEFSFNKPTNQETLQNQPIIYVDLNLVPKLQPGDSIQLFLDGAPIAKPAPSTHFELTNTDRGTHQLSATLFDENNNTLKQTATITIFVHKASLGPANTGAKQ